MVLPIATVDKVSASNENSLEDFRYTQEEVDAIIAYRKEEAVEVYKMTKMLNDFDPFVNKEVNGKDAYIDNVYMYMKVEQSTTLPFYALYVFNRTDHEGNNNWPSQSAFKTMRGAADDTVQSRQNFRDEAIVALLPFIMERDKRLIDITNDRSMSGTDSLLTPLPLVEDGTITASELRTRLYYKG